MTPDVVFVVPCFDEEHRLDVEETLALAAHPGVAVVLVDDRSRDGTLRVLESLAARAPRSIRVLRLPQNRGKGNAVREGLRAGVAMGAELLGFADADFSTPTSELLRLKDIARSADAHVVSAARVAMAGTVIRRRAFRHYLGRVFATAASMALDVPYYDTQCGAKIFRNTPLFRAAIAEPFASRWVFDVELIGRLLGGVGAHDGIPFEAFREVPLLMWTDRGGSRIRLRELTEVPPTLLAVARSVRERTRSRSR